MRQGAKPVRAETAKRARLASTRRAGFRAGARIQDGSVRFPEMSLRLMDLRTTSGVDRQDFDFSEKSTWAISQSQ